MKLGAYFSHDRGFTLVELMVTLAVAAILATIAAPMLTGFLARSQMNAVANDFTGALQLARLEAVSRNTCVAVCRRAPTGAAQCAGDDGAWNAGWIVYDKPSCEGSAEVTDPPAGTSLRAREAVPASISVNTDNGKAPEVIVFTPRGVILTGNHTMQFTDARFPDNSNSRRVITSMMGRVRTVAGLDGGLDE